MFSLIAFKNYLLMIYSFKGFIPIVHESAFVHPLATVTGNVVIGKHVYIGPGAAIRGDWGAIIIKDGCNVQENCTIHMFPGTTVLLNENAHIGHGAIIHGATIGRDCLIGMNAVIMDDVVLGDACVVGALSFIKAGMHFESRSMIVGNPAKLVKEVTDDMLDWKKQGTALYQQLPNEMRHHWKECEPLREVPKERFTEQLTAKSVENSTEAHAENKIETSSTRNVEDKRYQTWQQSRNDSKKD
jgi:carbonic anhydrase/acetyltransferase-like protein (isoleucine patch superfamily)